MKKSHHPPVPIAQILPQNHTYCFKFAVSVIIPIQFTDPHFNKEYILHAIMSTMSTWDYLTQLPAETS